MSHREATLKYARSEKGKAKMKEWQLNNKEKRNDTLAAWREKNRIKINDQNRKFRVAHPEYLKNRAYRAKYGIGIEDVKNLLELQGGKCAICERELDMNATTKTKFKPNVDHCHQTGKVRGILCRGCNTAIAVLGDTEEGITRAVTYLRKFNGRF